MKTLLLLLLPILGYSQISKVDSVRQLVKHGVHYKYIAPVDYAEPKEICRAIQIERYSEKQRMVIGGIHYIKSHEMADGKPHLIIAK